MRKIGVVIFGLLVASHLGAAGSGALSLKLAVLDPNVKSGARIMIEVTTTNQSDQTVTYHDTSRVCDYPITVLAGNGVAASKTAYKKQSTCGAGQFATNNKNILVTLKPGESKNERIEITELYDVSQPGEYSVSVQRTFSGIGHFSSNSVSIVVTP